MNTAQRSQQNEADRLQLPDKLFFEQSILFLPFFLCIFYLINGKTKKKSYNYIHFEEGRFFYYGHFKNWNSKTTVWNINNLIVFKKIYLVYDSFINRRVLPSKLILWKSTYCWPNIDWDIIILLSIKSNWFHPQNYIVTERSFIDWSRKIYSNIFCVNKSRLIA